jgi:hypothetical protein
MTKIFIIVCGNNIITIGYIILTCGNNIITDENEVQYLKKNINSDIWTYNFFFKVDRGRIQTFLKEGANRETQTQRLNFI